MIISNTPTLEGYRIVKYLGNVIGAHIYAPGGIFGEGIIRQTKLVAKAYTLATDNMKNEAPYETDAIVGVNTTVTQLIDGTALVTVSGTAVKTEKIITEEEKRRLQEEKEKAEKELQEKTRELMANVSKKGINPAGKEAVYPIEKDNGRVECPSCGTIQLEGRHVCQKCGIPFMY